jgi:hypothetical protein
MIAASIWYLGITVVLLAIFVVIVIKTYARKNAKRGEEPKYRMLKDD